MKANVVPGIYAVVDTCGAHELQQVRLCALLLHVYV
jgi:hypothetical protein